MNSGESTRKLGGRMKEEVRMLGRVVLVGHGVWMAPLKNGSGEFLPVIILYEG
jgi:hypothetical protein